KFDGGYLFLQSIYHELRLPSVCRKIREKHHYEYDLNAILSDLVYTRVLDPGSKCSSYKAARKFLEPPMRSEEHTSELQSRFDLSRSFPSRRSSDLKFDGGYLFLQSIYHELRLPSVCRKIREKHHYEYDLNAILSDLVYTRVLDPGSKCSSYKAARKFLEPPM